MKLLLLAVLALLAVHAADAQPESAYYGLSLGNFDYEESDAFTGNVLFSDKVSSYRLMVGYQFMEHMGVEGGYGETGTIRDTLTLPTLPSGTIDVAFRSEFKILTIRILGILPLDDFALLGGLGYADMKQKFAVNVGGFGEQSSSVTGNEPAYYLGAQYNWDRFALRLGFEKYDFEDDVDVSETSLSFFYKL